MLLDEIDKVSSDYKGDTSAALLEVLDGEQNVRFRDHYVEVPIDLSEVLFIATANTTQTIPRPLLDRMDIIEVNSYTENEKFHIAKDYLVGKQLEKNGLTKKQLSISDSALEKIIRNYTREAGVRNLERRISDICRKSAREILENKKKSIRVTEHSLEKYLGKERVTYENANEEDQVGIVRGLAWTSVGGDTLQIEVNTMPGKGELMLTGQMGDVMKESARTALTYVRSVAMEYGVAEDYLRSTTSTSTSRRGGAQGRPVGGNHHGHGHAVRRVRATGVRQGGHDRRDHPAGPGPSHRRIEGENPGRPDGRH